MSFAPTIVLSMLSILPVSVALAAPITPTVKLLPDEVLSVEVDLSETRGAWESGSTLAATILMDDDSTAYDLVVKFAEGSFDPAMPTTTLGDVASRKFTFNLRPLDSSSAGAPVAREIAFEAAQQMPGGPISRLPKAIIPGANVVGLEQTGVLTLELVPTAAMARPFTVDPSGEATWYEGEGIDFGGLSIGKTVSTIRMQEGEVWNAPITPTVKALESMLPEGEIPRSPAPGGPDPEIFAPITPTVKLREPRNRTIQGSVWGG